MDAKSRRALADKLIKDIATEAEDLARYAWLRRPHRWNMNVSAENVAYGTYPVILSRGGEFIVGSKSPYGPITSTALNEDDPYLEYRREDLEAQGWTVTCPPVPGRKGENE